MEKKWGGREVKGEEVRKDGKKTLQVVEGKGKEGVRGEGKVESEVFISSLHNRISPRLLAAHVHLPHNPPVTRAGLPPGGLAQ